jgi:hypothetical protein
MSLIIAKQKAVKAVGQTFYVTKKGVLQSFQLFGEKYTYKVTANDKEIIIEGPKTGRKTEKRTDKAAVSQKMSDAANAKTDSGTKRTRSKASTD